MMRKIPSQRNLLGVGNGAVAQTTSKPPSSRFLAGEDDEDNRPIPEATVSTDNAEVQPLVFSNPEGGAAAQSDAEREALLKELTTVSSLPEEILDIATVGKEPKSKPNNLYPHWLLKNTNKLILDSLRHTSDYSQWVQTLEQSDTKKFQQLKFIAAQMRVLLGEGLEMQTKSFDESKILLINKCISVLDDTQPIQSRQDGWKVFLDSEPRLKRILDENRLTLGLLAESYQPFLTSSMTHPKPRC